MVDVVQPSYNICSDLRSQLKQFVEIEGNDFWLYLQKKHSEMVLKYSEQSRTFLDEVHAKQVSRLKYRFHKEASKQHIIDELKKFHDNARSILDDFISLYRFQMSRLMHFLWVSRKPTHKESRRYLFLFLYKVTCRGIWSTFHPAIRRLLKGVEEQMDTLFYVATNSENPIPAHVPLFYVPVSSPQVFNDLMKLRTMVKSNLSERLAKYFRTKVDSMIKLVRRNLTNFENGLKGYYKHLLSEPLKSEMFAMAYDDNELSDSPVQDDKHVNLDLDSANSVFASDKSFDDSNIIPESKPDSVLKLGGNDESDRPESPVTTRYASSIKSTSDTLVSDTENKPKKRIKTTRVNFGHVESGILSSIEKAIAEKYTEIITPMETSVIRLSTWNILYIQLKFYEFVKELNEICASFIESGYLIYKRLN